MSCFWLFAGLPTAIGGLFSNQDQFDTGRVYRLYELRKKYPDGLASGLLDGDLNKLFKSEREYSDSIYSTDNISSFIGGLKIRVVKNEETFYRPIYSNNNFIFSNYNEWALTKGGMILELSEQATGGSLSPLSDFMKHFLGDLVYLDEDSNLGFYFTNYGDSCGSTCYYNLLKNNFLINFVKSIAIQPEGNAKIKLHKDSYFGSQTRQSFSGDDQYEAVLDNISSKNEFLKLFLEANNKKCTKMSWKKL
ncbi:hypothetical protein SCLARK_00315 [Spiroplasma clarkii]|uniref:hypothetical protein n=1 Tax=Spiroplasma clarkii TaxID=2139 RepID=UPI000B5496F8|nr:hypothetical protein [Spiroplasma clarkii]ARU91069.1 hypothetical protein SCLARK_00315 [Spiroplasma clarkii]